MPRTYDASDLDAAFLEGVNHTAPATLAALKGDTAQRLGGKALAGKWRKVPEWIAPLQPALFKAGAEALTADPTLSDSKLREALVQAALPDTDHSRDDLRAVLTRSRLATVRNAARTESAVS